MENPETEIEGVIRALTQSKPSDQRAAILKYFTPNASFTHPFCRTGSFDGSRALIVSIYSWYRSLSPRIQLDVHSVAFDKPKLQLYVVITQTFRIFFVPFYRADVRLVTELGLQEKEGRYYISKQNDLYQADEAIRFLIPFGIGALLVILWQHIATGLCVLGAAAFWPISWFEDHSDEISREVKADVDGATKQIVGGLESVKKRL